MQLLLTERFRRAYRALSVQDRKRIQKALHLMAGDLSHPSLVVKRVQGTTKIWEARASRSLRITFEVDGRTLVLRNVGHHQNALRKR
jgi:mRNA-degrading endonuclease RelE of RelBE toxin-antitoxin system